MLQLGVGKRGPSWPATSSSPSPPSSAAHWSATGVTSGSGAETGGAT